jgi:hypothetical protein
MGADVLYEKCCYTYDFLFCTFSTFNQYVSFLSLSGYMKIPDVLVAILCICQVSAVRNSSLYFPGKLC